MTARIEEVTGLEWIDALYRAHAISEYMLYGFAVCSDAELLRRHRCTTQSPCFSYWDRQPLDAPPSTPAPGGARPLRGVLVGVLQRHLCA